MIPTDGGPTKTLAPEAQTPSGSQMRRLTGQLGARLRSEVQGSLESLLAEASRLRSRAAADPSLRASADAVERAAREIAARLSRFESAAAEVLGEGAEAPAGTPGLTLALAGELRHLAQQAEADLGEGEVDRLRPRLRRAARLANLWLTTSVSFRGTAAASLQAAPGGAGAGTSTVPGTAESVPFGPAVRASEGNGAAPLPETPEAEVEDGGARAVAVALRDRLRRTEDAYQLLRDRSERRDRYWRYAVHELRNAAHAFLSWGFVLRRSELRKAPWFAPLMRAADAVVLRAEEALEPGRVENEAGLQVSPVPTDLSRVVTDALEAVRPIADMRDLSLAVAVAAGCDPSTALADPRRVHQILQNLLRNAIEATPAGGAVSVSVRDEERAIAVEVEDTGPGVPDDLLEALADEARPGVGQPRGFGIGLRLCRDLAGRMGGTLVIEAPESGVGARFVLRLPRIRP